jgi:hypothetical protein
VGEQKLDLIQFAAREAAEAGASAPQVVWGQLVDAGASRRRAHDSATLGDMPSHQTRAALLIARRTAPCAMAAAAVHASTALFTHVWDRDGSHMSTLAGEIGKPSAGKPSASPVAESTRGSGPAAESTSNQHRDQRVVAQLTGSRRSCTIE